MEVLIVLLFVIRGDFMENEVIEAEKVFVKFEDEKTEIEENGVVFIEEKTYRVFDDGTREIACSAKYAKPLETAPQPTQLDRMEAALQKNYAQAQQDGADAITQELLERGIL